MHFLISRKVLKLLIIEVHNVVGFEALYEKSGLYMAVTIIVVSVTRFFISE